MLKYFFTISIGILTAASLMAQPVIQSTSLYNQGTKFKEKAMYNEAIASFKKAIALNKKYDAAYLEIANIYARINKADSAIVTLKNAIKARPAFVNAYIAIGDIYRDVKNNPDEAISNYSKAIKIDSSNKVTFYSLAWCYNTKKYYREAIKYGVKALGIDNNYKPAYNELGHAYHQLKAYQECIEQFKKNLAISVNELPLLYSGYSFIELKQKEGALKMADGLRKINPKMADGLKKKIDAMQ